ncbi:PREDICTED: FLYWCH family member 2 [Elephantulus edwardii]|uniref:FLYWCH family member 2 n=1 Tax=Elephantulus edwardii TaxID=28737 RepID=UPI0003F0C50C|nr:PREDICTED: FLYWCH family member 2 [Elephantulus edwardii]
MSLPESSEQESQSQEPTREPRMDVVPAVPPIPKKFSKLVLLTASKDSAKVTGAKRKGVHCIMSLGIPGPATLAKALLKIHPEAQRAIEAAPQEPEPQEPEMKRSRPDTDAEERGDGRLTESAPPHPGVEGEEPAPFAGEAYNDTAAPGSARPCDLDNCARTASAWAGPE